MSVQPIDIDLKQLIKNSGYIVHVKRGTFVAEKNDFLVNKFEIIEHISGNEILSGPIDVFPANLWLYEAIEESRKLGEPVPMPILPFYKGSVSGSDYASTNELILFLTKDGKNRFSLATEGSYEAISEKEKIRSLKHIL